MTDRQTVYIELQALPPSVNAVWKHGRGGAWKTARYNSWIAESMVAVRSQIKHDRVPGFCGVKIQCVKPSRRRMDLDNRLKGLLDLLVTTDVIDDDSFIQRIEIEWVPVGEPVQIWVIATNEVPIGAKRK